MKRFRTILFLSSVFVLLLLVLRWSSVAANSGLSNRFSPTFISFKHEVEFRRSIGFKSNETHIKVVHAASDSIFVESLGGIALTPAEFEELQIRLDVEKDVDTILEFFKTSPELQDAFGGIYIEHFAGAEDHSKGGKLVLQLVAGHIQSEDVFHGLNLQRPDRLQVEWVRFSQEELQEQYDRLVLSSSTVFQGLFMHTKLNRVGVIVDLPLERNELQEPLSKEFLPDNLLQLVTHPAIVVYNGRIEVEQIALIKQQTFCKS
jgi:hypothetical protein